MATDPICGMDVDEEEAEEKGLVVEKDGGKVYFCSRHCRDEFSGKKNSVKEKLEKGKRTEKITVGITGMTCASCVLSIENALKSMDGVYDVRVNFASERVHIEYDPARISREKLESVIKKTGYNVAGAGGKDIIALDLKVIGMDNPHCVGRHGKHRLDQLRV